MSADRKLPAEPEAAGHGLATGKEIPQAVQDLAAASISLIVAATRFADRLNQRDPIAGPISERTLAGIRRSGHERGRGQAKGISWREADLISTLAANDDASMAGKRDAAIVAVMSDCLLRAGEVSALSISDIEADGSNTITVRRLKTDQEGRGASLFIGDRTLAMIRTWATAAGLGDPAAPLFQRLSKGGKPLGKLSEVSIRKIVRTRAQEAGIEGRITGHSLRVGSAQSLVAAGAGLVDLQLAGRWGSPAMPARYARGQIAASGAVARLRYGQ